MFRVGSYSMIIGMYEECGKIGKIMGKRETTNPFNDDKVIIYIVKLNYNGSIYLIQEKDMKKPTKEEKKANPKNEIYWKNEFKHIDLCRFRFVDKPEPL